MKLCEVKGCERKIYGQFKRQGKILCKRHYDHMRLYGRILKRTIHTRNKILLHKGYADVVLCNNKLEEIAKTKIDLDDVTRIEGIKWCLRSNGYVVTRNKKGRNCRLHRFILKAKKNQIIDHKNGDPLDNRKQNLRFCSISQNNWNRKNIDKRNTSGFTGVSWNKKYNKWEAYITHHWKRKNLGYFSIKKDAIMAYRTASQKMFKEFSQFAK